MGFLASNCTFFYLLIYFANKLAQPIRLLLAYCEQDWEDKFYEEGDAPNFDQTEWLRDKFALDLDFPNVRNTWCSKIKSQAPSSNSNLMCFDHVCGVTPAVESASLRL